MGDICQTCSRLATVCGILRVSVLLRSLAIKQQVLIDTLSGEYLIYTSTVWIKKPYNTTGCCDCNATVLVLSKLKKIKATAPQPQRNVFKYFAIFKNIAHSLKPGETPSYSASHQAPNYVQRS